MPWLGYLNELIDFWRPDDSRNRTCFFVVQQPKALAVCKVMRGDRGFNSHALLGGKSAGIFPENTKNKGGQIQHSGCIFSPHNCQLEIVCKMTFCMVFKIFVAPQDKSHDFSSPTSIFSCPG
jgi:hypothetical protein